MSQRNNEDRKAHLARAIAGGGTVAAWARENQVASRTAYTWSRCRQVRDLVERIQRRAIDRAVGRLSKNATAAADQIARLAKEAESDAIKLQASRAVLSDLLTVSKYATLDRRLAAIERRLARARDQAAATARTEEAPPCPAS